MDNSDCGHNFLSCYPEIAKEWNYEKNPLGPEMYTPHSGKKVWWKCSRCGYEWDARIYSRASGSSCPACTHQRVWPGHNDLKTLFPEIAQYWDSEKNNLSADQVFPNSAKKYWWTCENGHAYLESPNKKVSMKTGCPICSGHRLQVGFNDLKTKYPEIAREWDYEKNTKGPDEIPAHWNHYAWWLCPQGHSYKTIVSNRTAKDGTGCPICTGREVLIGTNDLASQYPEIAKQWHPTKNGELTPQKVTGGSNKIIWWICPICGNEWRTTVASRTSGKTSCPKCKRWFHTSKTEQILFYYIKKVFSDAVNSYRLHGKYEIDIYVPSKRIGVEYDGERWHGEKKVAADEIKGKAIIESQIRFYRIREPKCGEIHDGSTIITTPKPRADFSHLNEALTSLFEAWKKENVCDLTPDVDIDRDIVQIVANFSSNVADRSLAEIAPYLIAEWDYEKNFGLKPESVPAHSAIKAWWRCKECGYSWKAVVASRVRGNGCPACYNKNRGEKVKKGHFHPGDNDLITVAPEIAKEWDFNKNSEDLRLVVKGSHKKYWWICPKGHSYEAAVNNRIKGRGCPYCAGKRK